MKAIVYIDGYNLYYGLLKGTPYKWLDLWAMARVLLKEDIELLAVKYFTAPVKTFPYDLESVDRQKIYLQALIAQGKVQIVQGFYAKHRTWAPVRRQFKKRVIVFNPQPTISKQLDWAASYYKNIPRDLPAKCQLPDEIPVGTHGNVIRRPGAWK